MSKSEKDIKVIADTYAETKRAINQLQAKLKELEPQIKESGFDRLESDTYKISVYSTAPRKTFDLEKFKELNPEIDVNKEEYYKIGAGSVAIKFTEIKKEDK